MKKLLLATTALIACGGTAFAADMRLPAQAAPPAVVAPVYNWTGFYIGGHVGGLFRDDDRFFGDGDARLLAGGQAGFDFQFASNWVFGIEGQYSWINRNDNGPLVFAGGNFNHRIDGLASVTGRIGYVWGPTLIYAKGGYAYADTHDDGVGAFRFNGDRDGYTIGGGIEYMFLPNLSAKIEYQYFDFDRQQLLVGAPLVAFADFREELHTIKLGINYRFNWGGLR
jgi:outer membrane immunogenic protein